MYLTSDKEEVARKSWEAFRGSKAFEGFMEEVGIPEGGEVSGDFLAGWQAGFVCAITGLECGAIQAVTGPTKPENN